MVRHKPGASPLLFGEHLMQLCAFVFLEDSSSELPPYEERLVSCHSNRLKLFGCIAVTTRAILCVYRDNNLGHGSPRLLTLWRKSDQTERTQRE